MSKIASARNDQDVDVKPLNFVTLYRWEDNSWSTTTMSAGYSRNDRVSAQPYFIVPADKGKFQVYIEAEGFQAVKSIGGKADGCWAGVIAYDATAPGWLVNQYIGCKISNYKESSRFVCGHPDVVLNDCKFKDNRGVECDWFCSFDLDVDDDDGRWIIYAPPIQKDSDYNYVVSYGAFTEKTLEWGSISISIDEVDGVSRKSRAKPGIAQRYKSLSSEVKAYPPFVETQKVTPTPVAVGTSTPAIEPVTPKGPERVSRSRWWD